MHEDRVNQTLTASFEAHAQQTDDGVEFWLARDLQFLLGYAKWENFLNVVSKAKTACEVSGHEVPDHFPDVRKMVELGSGSQRSIDDIMLTRYACYLIAQNGDPKKPEIAFSQSYFALQTRRAELIEQRLLELERISARKKLSETEKELSDVIYQQVGGNQNFAIIRSKGDHALFGKSTQAMKSQWQGSGKYPRLELVKPSIYFGGRIMEQDSNKLASSPDSITEKLRDTAELKKVVTQAVVEAVEKARKLGFLKTPSVQEEAEEYKAR